MYMGVGKLESATEIATAWAAEESRRCCLFVVDQKTGLRFLVDSGAEVSITPSQQKLISDETCKLYAANNTEILTFGSRLFNLDLGLRRQFQWSFIVAKLKRGIVEADFLNEFKLLVDIKQGRLIYGATKLSFTGELNTITSKVVISVGWSSLQQTKEAGFGQSSDSKTRILIYARQRYYTAFEIFVSQSTIYDGKKKTEQQDHVIPIAEIYKNKTAIITPFGLYKFNVRRLNYLPCQIDTLFLGLKTFTTYLKAMRNDALSTFQRFVNKVFYGLDFLFPYLNDILIASASLSEHRRHLQVLDRLHNYGLRINISKLVLDVHELEFLGYHITKNGSKPFSDKVEAIVNYRYLKLIDEIKALDYDLVADAQIEDTELENFLQSDKSSLEFKKHRLPSGKFLWCDISTTNICPFIPSSYQMSIFHQVNGLAHPGIKATVKLIAARYIWPDMNKDIRKWTRACEKNKINRHTKSEVCREES
ncbi:hypothetical protein ILUMI_09356 [Ignelater luminosus]|uniref:RNA-directed DNA polymerase n=1 Tax=Ignelater luminosus TaxID=2038154 RepID=A0A8K0GCI2_IGNLU|nr:hypothetical protein ILUMI_09356 [Ignelater luminosus]